MTNSNFKLYSDYYDLLYSDKKYDQEVDYIVDLMHSANPSVQKVLEFGSGTGKHGKILSERGYDVTGVEISKEMVAIAQNITGFDCINADIKTVRFSQKFDVVLALFHVLSYQTSNASVSAVFENASLHLNQDGLFIFDFWYAPAVYSQKPEARIKRQSNDKIEIIRLAEPVSFETENRVDVNYTVLVKQKQSAEIKTINERHSMRYFSLLELDFFAENHCFERVLAEEYLTQRKPGPDTWGVNIVYKKRNI